MFALILLIAFYMMASSRKPSMISTYVTDKRISQWEELMRKFSQSHKEQFKTASLNIPRATRSAKFFPTGSQYEGSWDVLGMSGYGKYTFPHGVVYEGDFEDGMFHGTGQLRYESGIVIRGKFVNGVMTERTLLGENVEYSEKSWDYCTMPDRRFEIEYEQGLKPGGQSNLTADLPTKEILLGYYDTGDGFYDPKTRVVYKYEDLSAVLRAPTVLEQQWIVKNCRVNPEKSSGPCPEVYEEFLEPTSELELPQPPAAGIKGNMTSFRKQSMYEDCDFHPQLIKAHDALQKQLANKTEKCVKLHDRTVQMKLSDWLQINKDRKLQKLAKN
ncbi:hypothetical protein PYW08_003376 [Mythimna loreyi]|uniref:Uncharacterized protein n=1 Tax=Mythimna loreyi TaxID=667449 RepID=A0ACC2QSY8_9NEOP|nr:hypothetical protein PYW08_003376 [Mythimna loreyi]